LDKHDCISSFLTKVQTQESTIAKLSDKVDELVEEKAVTESAINLLVQHIEALAKKVEKQDLTPAFIQAKCSSGHNM